MSDDPNYDGRSPRVASDSTMVRFGRARGSTRRLVDGGAGSVVAAAIGGAFLVGVLAGGALTLFGAFDLVAEPVQTAAALSATYRHCPDGEDLGNVTRGDRVFITARDASGGWLQVRSPLNSNARVWMRAADVLPDAELGALPVLPCDVPVEASVVTTATTEASDTTATTEASDTTATTEASDTTATTAAVPDTAPPAISNAAVNPGQIWEQDGGVFNIICPAGNPRQAIITATVSDDSGVASVTAAWSDPMGSHSQPMGGAGGTYSTSFGPYAADTWDPDHLSPFDHLVTITITARDTAGNQASTTVNAMVIEAGECFG